ncbi:T9SS sorting signal type C domain-containing protein [Flavobacterium sp.]|jgi:hypothetical protein|uniref:T9SS sorting signal type C domain-containing protein n=1 Tax=Flavobacterium sp. TaxID=239 RepID=UPI0022CAC8C3|nr:T9SS sorting signal type C domain-containing protein [Flavobacterium sp.]MCZ8228925.1 T9SS sorting signal type C domain-containing protein [Flavobacterium sp.]
MKRILLIAVLLMVQLGFGQVSSYTFSQSIETYASLSGGTVAHNVSWDDSVTPNSIPLGFTFYFNEVEYTTCSVNSDGYLTFGTTISEAQFRNPISSTRGYQGAISALAIDLVDGGASIVYQTIGTAPNRTFVVQWANAKRYADRAASTESFNFQIRLNETSNTIQVVYGDCRTSSSTDRATEVGLRGANNSDFNNRIVTNNWTSSTAGTANNAICNTGNDAGELPTNGLTYKWTPVPPTITSLSSTNGCAGSTIIINGTRLTGATAANVRIGGTPVASITSISSTQIVAVVGSGTTGLVTVTKASGTATSASTFTVNPAPTSSNAGVDQSGNSTSYTLSANTPTVGTGAWSIISGPNTSLTQFSNVSNPAAIFTPSVSGSFVLSWTITNGSCTSSDQIAITPCINNLITNGDFANGGTGWTFATTKGRYVETNPENIYFSTGNPGSTAELDSEASLRQTVTVTPGVSYTLSFVYALRGGATSPGAVDVKVIGGTTPVSTIFTTTSNIPSTETFTFTPSSTSIAIEFFNSLSGSSTLGTIIDNIVLVPSSQVTPSATTIPKGVFNTLASCAGTPVQLDVENVPSTGVTYSWTGSAGVTFSATNIKNPIATFTNNGLNEATVTVTTAGGCISSSTTYVNINRTNGPTITTTATPAVVLAVCQSVGAQTTSMAYTATTNSPTSYRIDWNTLADQGSTAFTTGGSLTGIVVPAGTPAGTYTGTMIVTNANCSSTKAISLTVGKTASSASSSPTLCQNSLMTPITHTTIGTTSIGSPSGLPTGVSAAWASNAITISGTPTQSGTFNYSIPLTGSCSGAVNATGTITVNPLPVAPTVGTITNVTCSSTTGSVVLSDLQNGWTITQSGTAPGSYTSSGTSYTVTGLAVGDYTFTVKNGTCTSASTPNVPIIDASSATWNGSGWVGSIAPDATKNIIIASSLGSPFAANLTGCSLTINTGVTATVPSGVTLTITNAVTTNGQLIFENNASLVQTTNATNTGAIEYRRTSSPMKNFDFTYWASPVSGQTAKLLSPNTLWDKYFRFSGSANDWVFDDGEMKPGVGFIIRTPKPGIYGSPYPETVVMPYAQPVAFKGVANNGDYTFTAGAGQFNLIGNPYPSAIDADKFINANSGIINGALYFWTHNTAIAPSGSDYVYTADDYASYTLTGGTGTGNFVDTNGNGIMEPNEEMVSNRPIGKIAAGQSFFVESQPTPTATQFVFNNSMRATGNNSQFFKQVNTKKSTKLEKNRIWLNLTNSGGAFKQLLVGYITGATNDWDNLYDGSTFDGQEFVDFYSVNQGKNLTIQGRTLPFVDTDIVPLGYRSTIAGSFDISIDNRDGALTNQEIWLEDKKTNTMHDLTKGKYTFIVIDGVENDRFVLKYTNKTLGTEDNELANKALIVSVKNKKITVTSSAEAITQVQVFDLLGRKVYDKSKINTQEWTLSNLSLSNQILIVKTTLANGAISNKKISY